MVVATDAPLLPHQLKRVARRVPLGIGRVGGLGENGSGDIFLAFSTANPGAARRGGVKGLEMLSNDDIDLVFEATVQRPRRRSSTRSPPRSNADQGHD